MADETHDKKPSKGRGKQIWLIDLTLQERVELRSMMFKAPAAYGKDLDVTRAIEALGNDDEFDFSAYAVEDPNDVADVKQKQQALAARVRDVATLPLTINNVETILLLYEGLLKKETVDNAFCFRLRHAVRRLRAALKGEEQDGVQVQAAPLAVLSGPPADPPSDN